ncbi:MAG: hypothetical protein KDA42_16950 [Planctomycetales bacterium]|nr:hypothetical protein [Planctomycetales bacterium]
MRFTKLFSWCKPQGIRASRRAGSDSQLLRCSRPNTAVAGIRSTDMTLAMLLPVGQNMSRRDYIRLIEEVFGDMSDD